MSLSSAASSFFSSFQSNPIAASSHRQAPISSSSVVTTSSNQQQKQQSSSSNKITISNNNPKHSSVEIWLLKNNRVYHANELIQGVVCVAAKDGWSHSSNNSGMQLQLHGEMRLTFPPQSNTNNTSTTAPLIKKFTLLHRVIPIQTMTTTAPTPRMEYGVHLFPFEFTIDSSDASATIAQTHGLFETYHGTFIHISYMLSISIHRGVFSRTLENKLEFILQHCHRQHLSIHAPLQHATQQQQQQQPMMISFNHTNMNTNPQFSSSSSSVQQPQQRSLTSLLPQFDIQGQFYSSCIFLHNNDNNNIPHDSGVNDNDDDNYNVIQGEIKALFTNLPISSLDINLNCIETMGLPSSLPAVVATNPYNNNNPHTRNNLTHKTTTIQSLQIISQHPLLLPTPILPIHMDIPTSNNVRICSSTPPTTSSRGSCGGGGYLVGMEYELQIVCKFQGGLTVVSNGYPILVSRR